MSEKDAAPPAWHSTARAWRRIKSTTKLLRREETPAEAELWKLLRGGRLGGFRFRRQHGVGPFVVDFFCWKANLVIELDGGIHSAKGIEDRARQEFLESRGLRVIRFSNDRVFTDPAGVLREITSALGPPSPTGSCWTDK
ncbi:MAG: endonuclease domain-containing protein [Thermoanaerobaculia bacterium]